MFLLTVAGIWAVACITPGPSTLLVLRYALTAPKLETFAAAAGTITGTLCWGIAGGLGVSAIFTAAPTAYFAIQTAGGLYLVWLGVRLFLVAPKSSDMLVLQTNKVNVSSWRAYRTGLAINLTNPKAALFVTSIFAVTVPTGAHFVHTAAAIVVMLFISAIYYTCLIGLITHREVAAGYLRAKGRIDLVIAGIFVCFGAMLLLSQR